MSTTGSVVDRIERPAQISAYPWNLTRRAFGPKQAEAETLVLGWIEEAACSPGAIPPAPSSADLRAAIPDAPAIVIGGQVDTASDASRYVGTLGVLLRIAAAERVVP